MSAAVRWLVVAAALVWPFLLESPVAHRRGIEACVLVLAGLALTPTVGWLRSLALHVPACMGVGALAAVAVLRTQALPLALVAGCLAGAVLGLGVAVAARRVTLVPVVGLAASVTVAGILLPALRLGSIGRPVVLGIDLGGERALYLAAAGLVVAVWLGLRNLSLAEPGWRLRITGMAPGLAARSGVSVPAAWRGGFLVSGGVSGAAGVVLVLLHMGVPPVTEISPAYAVALLAIPLVGGLREPDGAVLGAAALWAGAAVLAALGVVEAELAAGGLLVAVVLAAKPGRGLGDVMALPGATRVLR